MLEDTKLKVRNFEYNGFYGQLLPGIAKYTLSLFIEWTRDPGIALFKCSDGKNRLIPTFAIMDWKEVKPTVPEQDMKNKVYFGAPCKS